LGPLEHDRRSSPGQGSCFPGQGSRFSGQGSCRGPRRRRCLLKGCERFFQPRHPQARYCGPVCQREARRWRCWRAGQTWRKTEGGRQCRRGQSCRYRQRVRQRREAERAAAEKSAEERREGQRPAGSEKKLPCARPGCYELFVLSPRSPAQRFCSCLCRNALRRVLQREARWGRRRKRGPGGRRRIPPWREKVRRRVL
jgi:hypothetical protein